MVFIVNQKPLCIAPIGTWGDLWKHVVSKYEKTIQKMCERKWGKGRLKHLQGIEYEWKKQ